MEYSNYQENLPTLSDWLTSRIQSFFAKLLYNQELSFLKNIKRGNNVRIGRCNNIINSKFGDNVRVFHYNNIYETEIGSNSQIASYVEIQRSKIGNDCKIGCGSFIPDSTIIGNSVFLGPKVVICNDRFPSSINENNELKTKKDWKLEPVIKNNVSIGAGVVILPGVTIEEGILVGAGSVVCNNLTTGKGVYYGNPAEYRKMI